MNPINAAHVWNAGGLVASLFHHYRLRFSGEVNIGWRLSASDALRIAQQVVDVLFVEKLN